MAGQEQQRTAFGAPPPDPELRRLDPLVGTWRAEDHTLDSVIGPGVPVRNEETFSWLEGGYFLVQTPFVLYGSRSSLREYLIERRQRLGISYISVPGSAMREFAPIVAELRGT